MLGEDSTQSASLGFPLPAIPLETPMGQNVNFCPNSSNLLLESLWNLKSSYILQSCS